MTNGHVLGINRANGTSSREHICGFPIWAEREIDGIRAQAGWIMNG